MKRAVINRGALSLFGPFCAILAMTSGARADRPKESDVAVSSGITFPSATSAVYQNVAGLVFTHGATVNAYTLLQDGQLGKTSTGLGVFYGDGDFGVSGGMASDGATAHTALAVRAPELRLSFGIAGFKSFDQGGASTFNSGALIEPLRGFHLGLTGINFLNEAREWGVGIGYDLVPSFSIVMDSSVSGALDQAWFQPAIVTRTSRASLTLGYGFPAQSGIPPSVQINNGVYLGGSLQAGDHLNIELRYRDVSGFYAYFLEIKVYLGDQSKSSSRDRSKK